MQNVSCCSFYCTFRLKNCQILTKIFHKRESNLPLQLGTGEYVGYDCPMFRLANHVLISEMLFFRLCKGMIKIMIAIGIFQTWKAWQISQFNIWSIIPGIMKRGKQDTLVVSCDRLTTFLISNAIFWGIARVW